MMKYCSILVFLLSFSASAEVEMTRVDASLFIYQPITNFDSVLVNNEPLKRKMMAFLFDNDMIDHAGTRAYDAKATFLDYYKQYAPLYRLIDLNNDQIPELIFNGLVTPGDDREFLEIYGTVQGNVVRLYREIGHLLAYKVQPNTKEILLYHHQYPCCVNASHNLNRLRLIGEKFRVSKYYFLGRDKDMVGPFFPKKSTFTGKYGIFTTPITLRWSPAVVNSGAWKTRSEVNTIADFDSLSVYTVLATENGWDFVLMKTNPKLDKKNRVINPANFGETAIYGWVRRED